MQPSDEVAIRLGVSFEGWDIGREGPLKVAYPATIHDAELIVQEVHRIILPGVFLLMLPLSLTCKQGSLKQLNL